MNPPWSDHRIYPKDMHPKIPQISQVPYFEEKTEICLYCIHKYQCLTYGACMGFRPQTQRKGFSYVLAGATFCDGDTIIASKKNNPLEAFNENDFREIQIDITIENNIYVVYGEPSSLNPPSLRHITHIFKYSKKERRQA